MLYRWAGERYAVGHSTLIYNFGRYLPGEYPRVVKWRKGYMSYKKGRRLEYTVRDYLRRKGWFAVRAAASRPFDVVGVKRGEVILFECKYGKVNVNPTRLKEQLEVAKRAGAKFVVARKKRGGKTKFYEVKMKNKKIELMETRVG